MVLTDLLPSRLSFIRYNVSRALRVLSHPLVLVTIITLFGAALRFYQLGKWSFWIDEYFTIRDVNSIGPGFSTRITNYLTLISVDLFGTSEWSARLVPCIIGILTIPILYLFVRRMFNTATATLAALLLAVAPWHVYWSQNARFYSLLMLFFTLSMLSFFEAVERRNLWWLGLSVVFTGLAVWEHATSLLAVIVFAAYLVLKVVLHRIQQPSWRVPKYAVLATFLFILALAPIVFRVLSGVSAVMFTSGQYAQSNNSTLWILMGVAFYVRIPILFTAIVGGAYLLIKRRPAGILLSLWIVIPLLSLLILTFFTYTANRYAFITLPAWIILASFAVVELLTKISDIRLKLLVLGLPLLLVSDSLGENILYHRYQNGNRDEWKGAVQFVQAHYQPGDLVISTKPEIVEFYLQEQVLGFGKMDSLIMGKPAQRIWFIVDMNIPYESEAYRHWIEQHSQQVAVLDNWVGGRNFLMRVFLYDPQFPPALSP